MLTTSAVMAELVREYVSAATRGGRECRVVAPGLTERVGAEIHEALRAAEINSYLAIGAGRAPDENRRWLEPASLTNMRIGSFVAITDPGAMAEVRDSIRGTGGTIRSIGFSEEWPWKDDGSEAFQFRGPFSSTLVARWAPGAADQAWLQSFLAHGLVPATRRTPNRGSLLLDDLIGAFDPAINTGAGGVCERFLLHCGVPKPASIGTDALGLVRETRELVRGIVERVRKESDLRRELLEKVSNSDPAAAAIGAALQHFFDGLAIHSALEGDILAFRHCWGPPESEVANWSLLTAAKLRELFEVIDEEEVRLDCTWLPSADVLVSKEGRVAAGALDAALRLQVRYAVPAGSFSPGECELRASVRNTLLGSIRLDVGDGEHVLDLQLSQHAVSHRTRVPVNVSIVANGIEIASTRVHVHSCGEERPAFVVGFPGFWVLNAEEISDDPSPAQRQLVNEPATLYFISTPEVTPEVELDSSEVRQVAKRDGSRIWVTSEPISALDAPGGQVTCVCHIGRRWLSVTLEAEDIVRGEFTIEDELRSMVAGCKIEHTRALLAIFDGASKEPYSRLGGVNKQSQRRTRLARCFESRMGWQPILADLLAQDEGSVSACGDFARVVGKCPETRGISQLRLPHAAVELVSAYAERRDAFRLAVLASLRSPNSGQEHPHYAILPFYLSDGVLGRDRLEEALASYLSAYCAIRSYLQKSLQDLTWEQVFVLSSLDCVVNWREDASKGSFFLIGPWHPLVAAKRFMVQRALVLRAQRLVSGGGDAALSHLAGLLGDISGFSWHAALRADDCSLEAAYVVPTSDPGWHFAFKREAAETGLSGSSERMLVAATNAIRQTLGLEARVRLPSTTAMVRSILSSYVRTFPSRRHLSVQFTRGFAGEDEIREADRFIHDDGASTAAGEQLPGGINASFGEPPAIPEEVAWSAPPLKVFRYTDATRCVAEQYPNVVFSGSRDEVRFHEDSERSTQPRSAGYSAVFAQPLSRLVQGPNGISQSLTLEWDNCCDDGDTPEVGMLFMRACHQNCLLSGQTRGIIRPAHLPESLAAAWTVVPGAVLDPAVFVSYVRDGSSRAIEHRALWDYRISVGRTSSSYFVLSTIPAAFRNALSGSFPGVPNLATECIAELGQLGLAIGGEAMRSGRHALGTLGVVAAVRLFHAGGSQSGAFEWSEDSTGFLIPVDSFLDLLERETAQKEGLSLEQDRRRGDLIAMYLLMPGAERPRLQIQALVIECKFTNATLDTAFAIKALGQSKRSMERLAALCSAAAAEDGIPERLALLQLVRFGLRISGGHEPGNAARIRQEHLAYRAILRGEFELCKTEASSLLVSTEMSLSGSAETTKVGDGLWIRLNRQHWPRVAETSAVAAARSAIRLLFQRREPQAIAPLPATPPPAPAITPVELETPTRDSPKINELNQPIASAEAPVTTPASTGASLQKFLVGMDSSRRAVYFDPHSPVDRLDNVNMMITGSSGKGKTQLVKYLVTRIREQGANATLIDFKNDFVSDEHFIKAAGLQATLVTFDGLPFNPLIPFPVTDRRNGRKFIQCAQHITGIAAVFRRTYSLGAQQEAAVKNAIRTAFGDAGVDPNGTVAFNPDTPFPDLSAVGEILAATNPTAYNRLDPLFTLGLFREQYLRISFDSMVNRSVALDFSQLPSDELKNALAELVILSAHTYLNAQPHSGTLRQMFVVDEAHRILKADFLERFALECRAYGVGLLLSSQYPSQFSQDISSSMATKIIHGNGTDVDRIREIVNLLGCAGYESAIADLQMFQAIFSNKHFKNVPIRTLTYPLHLAYKEIEARGPLAIDEIARVPGIDPEKLTPKNIIFQLERLGLCEMIGERARAVQREG